MQLKVLSRYRSGLGDFTAGQLLHLPDEEARLLMRDSPGSFEVIGEDTTTGLPAIDRRQRGGKLR